MMLESIKTKMQKYNLLTSIPAYLPIVNIDTDMIIPKQFLKTIKRTGLGKNLFFEMRYDDNGNEIKDFILNQEPHNQSKILIAGKNFGCGSSREHAPWALLDFGITCVISSSYADIFYSNCFKNGILPIILTEEKIKELSEYSKRKEEISIDLNEEKIIFGNNEIKDFILNQEPHNQSKILIAGKNFGCGSSREHAPWALLDFGITCVISSSYADIFYSNCFKNGILPITLPEEKIKELSEYSKRKEEISIDLKEEKIIFGNTEIKFDIDPFKKKCLLEGLDDIALSLAKKEKITYFEENLKNNKPWIFND